MNIFEQRRQDYIAKRDALLDAKKIAIENKLKYYRELLEAEKIPELDGINAMISKLDELVDLEKSYPFLEDAKVDTEQIHNIVEDEAKEIEHAEQIDEKQCEQPTDTDDAFAALKADVKSIHQDVMNAAASRPGMTQIVTPRRV